MLLALSVSLCYAQKRAVRSRTLSADKVKINKNEPGLYIAFERFGRRTPLREDESQDGVYLRLHNNLRYSIGFCSFGMSEDGEMLIAADSETQIGVNYDVEITDYEAFGKTRAEKPSGYPTGSICFGFVLKAGRSVVFSAPKEHLAKGLSIKIPFNYAWESPTETNPMHYVYFNSYKLPK